MAHALLAIAILGSGMMAGLFGAFSTFMMQALGAIDATSGAQAMQAINQKIQRPSFFVAFFGTPLAALASLWLGLAPDSFVWVASGAGVYTVGCLLSTIVFNVPLNNRLDAVDAATDEGKALWQHYLVRWTRWNHVRSVATFVATLLLCMGLFLARGS